MKALALNPFHGGSHKAFLDGWQQRSNHQWTTLTLTDSYWKWRLQFAAVKFAEQANELWEQGERWDVIFCTSMMNVADFRALTPQLSHIPLIVYFHENQLTYPESDHMKFDLSLCMINIKSALVAERVWFNSEFHRDNFLSAAARILKPKPESPLAILEKICEKSEVHYQAIDDDFLCERKESIQEPLKIVWAARWELDKNPELLFKALRRLRDENVNFELYFLGEEMHTALACIESARKEFSDSIKAFGYVKSREEYKKILQNSDIFISTANHEFFGITAVEAVAAGCIPIVPHHQSYPEILKGFDQFLYKPRSAKQLAESIKSVLTEKRPKISMSQYFWSRRSAALDNSLGIKL